MVEGPGELIAGRPVTGDVLDCSNIKASAGEAPEELARRVCCSG